MSALDDVKSCFSEVWTSSSPPVSSLPPPSSFHLFSLRPFPSTPPTLSLSEPQSALYKTSLHTQIYKHLRSHHSASEPCVRKYPSTHLKRLNSRHLTLPEWAGEDSFLLPHLWTVFFTLYFSSSLAADNGSEGDLFVCLQQLRKSRTVWHEERRSTKRHEDHMSVDCRRAAVSHLSGELNIILIWPFFKFSHRLISLWLRFAVFIKRHFYKWVSVKSSNKLELIILRSRCCLIVWPI